MNIKPFSFSLVSFNILGTPYAVYKTPSSRLLPKHRKQRFIRIAEELNSGAADIVCFQEVHTYPQVRLLKKTMTEFPYISYKKFLYGPRGGLVTFSKFPIHSSEYITFNKMGTIRNKSIVAKISRKGILLVKLEKEPLYILNTHLTANIDWNWVSTNRYIPFITSQLEQLKNIVKSLSNFPIEIIIAGDFNIPKNSMYYKMFTKGLNLMDVFQSSQKNTYNEEHLPLGKKSECVDFIFIVKNGTPFKVEEKEYVFDKKVILNNISTFLSDHIGLRARLQFAFGNKKQN